jgi:uncharacterized membrane protein
MKNSKSLFCLLGLILPFVLSNAFAGDAALKFTYALVNIPGSTQTNPNGISNTGVVVGTYYTVFEGQLLSHAYVQKGTKLAHLDDPKAALGGTTPNNLNPDEPVSIVGSYVPKNDEGVVGFLYKNGTYTDISGPSGALASVANAINDSGNIVGAYIDSQGSGHGFVLKNSVYTTLDVPGAISTIARGINKSGDIVLNWVDANGNYNASLFDGTTYNTINVPNAVSSQAMGISASGDVCYEWTDAIGVYHGALLHAGVYSYFDVPTHGGTWAYGMNDIGNIVGNGTYHSTVFGFKATYGTH